MPQVFVKNVIDFDVVANKLQPKLTTMSTPQILSEFKDWFWGIQDSEFWFYSEAQAKEHIEFLTQKFLEEYYIYPHALASQLGMEVVEA